jgi:hypothetical protein
MDMLAVGELEILFNGIVHIEFIKAGVFMKKYLF